MFVSLLPVELQLRVDANVFWMIIYGRHLFGLNVLGTSFRAHSLPSKLIQLKNEGRYAQNDFTLRKSLHLPFPALFFAAYIGLAPCWRPHFIPWSHYCLQLRCPCSLWFVGNELAPPCPCSIILIEKVISHSTEQIGECKSMNSNQELTCSQPAVRRGRANMTRGGAGVDRIGAGGKRVTTATVKVNTFILHLNRNP